ncbi:hypothetical protein BO94DRAFT_584775 [Aspergillus sclerotioniger CBS 115572]|uniref:Ubiquitin-like domain-containing protein n=1 Tax=Aspergillus sclerotioniger CBS 115572 TaxID=1450535 RepID=A0A317WW27_9EURO|nr:hypothetical protein BO94DRAFT_584775 [Aspergillus sclerotioniger CBS 115572]PWY89522.1 hypothetical protein BO94DRAFT_584775 [Aspergillus sclerotioniger CBS 115572]
MDLPESVPPGMLLREVADKLDKDYNHLRIRLSGNGASLEEVLTATLDCVHTVPEHISLPTTKPTFGAKLCASLDAIISLLEAIHSTLCAVLLLGNLIKSVTNPSYEPTSSELRHLLEEIHSEDSKEIIIFEDAIGRKHSLQFNCCRTWIGMEKFIRQAFLQSDVIETHVAKGYYDLMGSNGDIILPQDWESVVEPGWVITMYLRPISEVSELSEAVPSKQSPKVKPLTLESSPSE